MVESDQPRRRRGLPRSSQSDHTPEDQAAPAEDVGPQPQGASPEQAATAASASAPRRMGMGAGQQSGSVPAPASGASAGQARRSGMSSQSSNTAASPPQAPSADATPRAANTTRTATSQKPKNGAQQKSLLGRSARQWWIIGPIALAGLIILAAAAVLITQWALATGPVADFIERYPGTYPQPEAPTSYPWWLNWAHFFNAFLMVLIIKTGIQIRTETRPAAHWTPRWNKKRKISLTIWLHNSLDLLWVLNGTIFVLLLFATDYWSRVVPTSWEVFPNALSAALQYVSLDWPTAGEWAHYNSLQELAYFTTIFIAAPVAIITGVRMSGLWPSNNQSLNTIFPAALARALHFPVMIYFAVFIIIHLILVLATDALANLNQIYTGQEATNWTGFWLFVLSLAVIVAGAFLARALFVAPIASLFGRVGR